MLFKEEGILLSELIEKKLAIHSSLETALAGFGYFLDIVIISKAIFTPTLSLDFANIPTMVVFQIML